MKNACLIIFILLNSLCSLFAQNLNFKIANGTNLNVEICSNKIFRFRVAKFDKQPESLMERYGLIKTNWNENKFTIDNTNDSIRVINLKKYHIHININSGDISINDSLDRAVVGEIKYIPSQDNQVRLLGEQINKRFSDNNKIGGIIGDDAKKSDTIRNTEVGDFNVNSIISIALDKSERFYGGGNTSRNHIQHRGEVLRMWSTYQKTEIPMPYVVSSRGWAIYNNTTVRNYFDIGVKDKNRLQIYNTTCSADFYMLMGDTMDDAINLYTTVTGRSFLLPNWAYGLCFGGNMLENVMEIMGDAVKFREEKIPCDMLWLEPQWMSKRYDFSVNKNWDYKKFPGEPYWCENKFPKKEHQALFIGRLHQLGYKLALWLCIDCDHSVAEEDEIAQRNGTKLSGQENWFNHLTKFMDEGVDGFKLDPARTIDEHPLMKYYNGLSDKEMHNLNQVLMPKQMYQVFREHTNRRSFHHYCGGWAGTQHWSASQSGDNGGGKTALYDQLNLSFCGYFNTSCDVMSGVDNQMAGLHLGVFLPWVQINSWFSFLHPWFYSPKQKETYKSYIQLRHDLFPYIYSAALESTQTGKPLLKAMPLAFPDDRNVDDMAYQYMFGDNLMVCIFSDSIYLPKGSWINYWTGDKIIGRQKYERIAIPEDRAGQLLIREGAIIPFQKHVQYIGESPMDSLILKIYPSSSGSSYTLLEDDGLTYNYEKGEISRTRFDCHVTNDNIDFIINPTEGHYDGMCKERAYLLEFYTEKRPKQMIVDGKKTKDWKYENHITNITINKHDINDKVEIILKY